MASSIRADSTRAARASGECRPALDIIETIDAVEVIVDVPGIPAAALAAARGLADRFGGDVQVVACPEGGAAVTLRLPTRRHRSLAA